MRLPAPQIIAIDDDPKHLKGLTQGLNSYGAACLPLHFTGEVADGSYSQVRVIFADLHLSSSPTTKDYTKDFSVIGGLIESTIKPSGPYLIVLWTMYPEQANKLHQFLAERIENVAKPFTVHALNKNNHLDPQGDVKDPAALVQAIENVIAQKPRIGALLNWEERVLGATAETLLSITKMAGSAAEDDTLDQEIGRLLRNLAIEAAGSKHIEGDRFRAVNDALLPILADRLASMRSQKRDDQLWENALGENEEKTKLSTEEAARINRFLHISPSANNGMANNGSERGAVISLPEEFLGSNFVQKFGICEEKAATEQFLFNLSDKDNDPFHWVLVQTQAACDYAQSRPGPLPFHLGLYLLESKVKKGKKGKKAQAPAALWCSPCFEQDKQVRCLNVSARFSVSLLKERASQSSSLFRLREQLLNNLIYHLHSYGARPGFISF